MDMRPLRSLRLVAAIAACTAAPLAAQGRPPQGPDSLVNTLVIPHNTPVPQVLAMMRGFTSALGVRCDYCHVEREGGPPNFPLDDKRTKRTARLMMRMVQLVNDSTLSRIPERPQPSVAVTCATCHRGLARPKPLADVVTETVTAAGLDSAVRAYRVLRDQYYGRASYDFGEGSLNTAAQALLALRRPEDALGVLRLNAEFFPNSAGVSGQMGEAYLAKADTANAIAMYRQALLRDPNDRLARQRLRALGVTN
jgi:hypothetical protein